MLALAELKELVNQQNKGSCITEYQILETIKKEYEKMK